ncbi:MAG: helix-turn-helix transcriptional regulator [Pseudonocardiales bacterium]|nr:helix-turn-helix transcriptional regulator [Pseudonocardiales bacterium]MBV9729656.1 helix-turn-helix transcriptional regulator [Pseudonocardiales bacterium]
MRLTDEATVGERVALYRRRKGITQEVLAGLLGRSVEWLAQFERGVKELDRLSTMVAIADALGIEPVKLFPAAFTTRRRELRDAVIGTAPDSVAAIKDAMFPTQRVPPGVHRCAGPTGYTTCCVRCCAATVAAEAGYASWPSSSACGSRASQDMQEQEQQGGQRCRQQQRGEAAQSVREEQEH